MSVFSQMGIGDVAVYSDIVQKLSFAPNYVMKVNHDKYTVDLYIDKYDDVINDSIKKLSVGVSVGVCHILFPICKCVLPLIDIRILNIINMGMIDFSKLSGTFVNVANHIKMNNYDARISDSEMQFAVSLADCVVMYADKNKTPEDTEIKQSELSSCFKDIPVFFVSDTFMSENNPHIKLESSLDEYTAPDWLAYYTAFSDDACHEPHIVICPDRMTKAITGFSKKLSMGESFIRLFLYAIVLIHEFAHARMNKQKGNISSEESYYMEETLANAIVLKYTEIFNRAEKCSEEYSLKAIAKKFIESQIYPYNAALIFNKFDIDKWVEMK